MIQTELEATPDLSAFKQVQIFSSDHQGELKPYSVASVIDEAPSEFTILCKQDCSAAMGRTYHARRTGFLDLQELNLSVETRRIVAEDRIVGYVHRGTWH